MTSPEQLSGRALDAEVAKVLGWSIDRRGGEPWQERSTFDGRWTDTTACPVRGYSKDVAALPEQLSWLAKWSHYAGVQIGIDEHTSPPPVRVTQWSRDPDSVPDVEASGATLNEAISRLVLAVSKQATGAAERGGANPSPPPAPDARQE